MADESSLIKYFDHFFSSTVLSYFDNNYKYLSIIQVLCSPTRNYRGIAPTSLSFYILQCVDEIR